MPNPVSALLPSPALFDVTSLPDAGVARGDDGLNPVRRDLASDEDLRFAHWRSLDAQAGVAAPDATKDRMRRKASVRFSRELAYEIRMWLPPIPPNAVPASTHTPAS